MTLDQKSLGSSPSRAAEIYKIKFLPARSSSWLRTPPSQGGDHGFESRTRYQFFLQINIKLIIRNINLSLYPQ